ncbi:TIGR04551 family protein [Anaeromyxobacter paludicola]|uniref:TIGR04551 family protein n=1 Tax=Anaeromyxobacter paludicola TaxID=2918171 RepID=A0ABM7XC17_9BACT|nr:TIGR04551 family protein [Anaeromyxobacter paludicola]BDG09409.1 hypothetical protein AMPC_25220 [Anaeromyxobacter paludicola]
MNRLLVALLAAPLLTGAAAPQPSKDQPVPAEKKDAAATPPAAPALTPEQDRAVKEAVTRELEKAKADLRDELRAELQGAQSAREFMDTADVASRPKLDFLQIHGYLRFRADLFDHLDLDRDPDPNNYWVYPRPVVGTYQDPTTGAWVVKHGTLTSANMRLRLEPVLNVSEQIRVLSQVDLLDNVILGSNPYSSDFSLGTFGTSGTTPPLYGVNSDRASIAAKRAWGEVQTPVGLLSFGRMPSSWGLGVLTHAGNGIDDDYGDTVDRIQFAIPVPGTPLGNLTVIPMWDYVASGLSTADVRTTAGIGQAVDRDQADDVRAIGVKIVHEDTEDELRRKLEQGQSSVNYGLFYSYRTQSYEFLGAGSAATANTSAQAFATTPTVVQRGAYTHTFDLWTRVQKGRLKVEGEAVGVYGQMDNVSSDPANPLGPVLLRQFGGVVRASYGLLDGKLTLSGEWGIASGDSNPGMGNVYGRSADGKTYGVLMGQQYAAGDKVLDIRSFGFNPAYRVDMIFWREIMKEVTEAWYLKPTIRWEMLPGLAGTFSVIYSQALNGESTPSSTGPGTGKTPLGIEGDLGLSYTSDDGFMAWLNYGLFQPLDGMDFAPELQASHPSLSRAHAIRAGLAVRF